MKRKHSSSTKQLIINGPEGRLLGGWNYPVDTHLSRVLVDFESHLATKLHPRRLVLMRPVGKTDPTQVYAGRIPEHITAAQVPAAYRQRWDHQETRIREMVKAANLNANYGYTYDLVPSRTRQRQWWKAQERVESVQTRLDKCDDTMNDLQTQLDHLTQQDNERRDHLQKAIALAQTEVKARRKTKRSVRRLEQRLKRAEQNLEQHAMRFQKRYDRLQDKLDTQRNRRNELAQLLAQCQADRDAIDTESLCRERHLEKDQVMLNLQVLLTSLHDWTCAHYFAPQWQKLELDTAMKLVYRKPGCVAWYPDRVEVTLDPYRYAEHQQAMQATCRRFNAANLHWRDGRRLKFYLAQSP